MSKGRRGNAKLAMVITRVLPRALFDITKYLLDTGAEVFERQAFRRHLQHAMVELAKKPDFSPTMPCQCGLQAVRNHTIESHLDSVVTKRYLRRSDIDALKREAGWSN